jgi:hypothetical protein
MRITWISFLCAVVLTVQGQAQDFKKVIEIVSGMESSLKKMIVAEAADRKAAADSLRSEIARLRVSVENGARTAKLSTELPRAGQDSLDRKFAAVSAPPDLKRPVVQDAPLAPETKKRPEEATVPVKQAPVPVPSSFKVGLLAQAYGQLLQEQITAKQEATPGFEGHWQRQMFVRRLRVLLGGDIAKNTSFFAESDATNIGKVEANGLKPTKVSMYIQDAYIQHTLATEFSVVAGLQLVGITRNSLQSAGSLMALDYGAYQFLTSTPFDNTAGRDLGVNFRGFLLDERLEYRAGVFSGKNLNLYSPLRTVVRLNYMFEDREKGFFYSGTTLSKGRLLSIGAGMDVQGSYRGYSVDAIADLPLTQSGSLTASGSVSMFDGGGSATDSTFFTGAIPRQNVFFAEVGYFFKDYGLQPYLKYESDAVDATIASQVGATPSTLDLQNRLRSKSRFGIGLNYYLSGHNASFKILYEFSSRYRVALDPTQAESKTNGELSIQLQFFSF